MVKRGIAWDWGWKIMTFNTKVQTKKPGNLGGIQIFKIDMIQKTFTVYNISSKCQYCLIILYFAFNLLFILPNFKMMPIRANK